MTELKHRRVLITGAAGGLGRRMAALCARRGADLVLWDLDPVALDEAARAVDAAGPGRVDRSTIDITDREAVYALAAQVGPVDVLVNNAGIVSGKSLLETSDEQIERTFAVNTLALFWTTRAFLPAMLERGEGHLVTVASAAGKIGVRGLVDYCASKFGAVGFDEALRMELRHSSPGVQTTLICPYFIDTGMFSGASSRVSRLLPILDPDEVAEEVVTAIENDAPILHLPKVVKSLSLLRALPVHLFDAIADALGINASMDAFQGHARDTPAPPPQAARPSEQSN